MTPTDVKPPSPTVTSRIIRLIGYVVVIFLILFILLIALLRIARQTEESDSSTSTVTTADTRPRWFVIQVVNGLTQASDVEQNIRQLVQRAAHPDRLYLVLVVDGFQVGDSMLLPALMANPQWTAATVQSCDDPVARALLRAQCISAHGLASRHEEMEDLKFGIGYATYLRHAILKLTVGTDVTDTSIPWANSESVRHPMRPGDRLVALPAPNTFQMADQWDALLDRRIDADPQCVLTWLPSPEKRALHLQWHAFQESALNLDTENEPPNRALLAAREFHLRTLLFHNADEGDVDDPEWNLLMRRIDMERPLNAGAFMSSFLSGTEEDMRDAQGAYPYLQQAGVVWPTVSQGADANPARTVVNLEGFACGDVERLRLPLLAWLSRQDIFQTEARKWMADLEVEYTRLPFVADLRRGSTREALRESLVLLLQSGVAEDALGRYGKYMQLLPKTGMSSAQTSTDTLMADATRNDLMTWRDKSPGLRANVLENMAATLAAWDAGLHVAPMTAPLVLGRATGVLDCMGGIVPLPMLGLLHPMMKNEEACGTWGEWVRRGWMWHRATKDGAATSPPPTTSPDPPAPEEGQLIRKLREGVEMISPVVKMLGVLQPGRG